MSAEPVSPATRPHGLGLPTKTTIWLRQHMNAGQKALRELFARPLDTTLTALVLGIAIALPVGLTMILQTVAQATHGWIDRHELSVFLDAKATPSMAEKFASEWQGLPGVTGTRIVTPDEAMRDLRNLLGLAELEATSDTTLLPYLVILELDRRTAKPNDLAHRLGELANVSQVQFDQDWLSKVDVIVRIGARVAIVLTILLAIGALVVIGNTIRLGVERRRDESEVLSLLGATAGFIRRPYLYHGWLHGLLGGLVGYLMVGALFAWLRGPIGDLAEVWSADLTLHWPSLGLGIGLLIASAALGTLAARISVKPELIISAR